MLASPSANTQDEVKRRVLRRMTVVKDERREAVCILIDESADGVKFA